VSLPGYHGHFLLKLKELAVSWRSPVTFVLSMKSITMSGFPDYLLDLNSRTGNFLNFSIPQFKHTLGLTEIIRKSQPLVIQLLHYTP
jgi:hypothetical protein